VTFTDLRKSLACFLPIRYFEVVQYKCAGVWLIHTSHPTRKPDILLQEAGEETLLYSPEGRAVHVLNPAARMIWERCDGQHSIGDIVQELRASFAVPPERDVERDVRRTLEVFVRKGLLQQMD
jgi:hypothetical protein